jgi:hypothetical protein
VTILAAASGARGPATVAEPQLYKRNASRAGPSATLHNRLIGPTEGGLEVTRDERVRDEYRALRATIVQRGTARMLLAPATIFIWAAIAVATAAVITVALSTLVPLLVLAAGFEGVFALHMNVERIGRYLQVFHEEDGAEWEHVAMGFGRQYPGTGTDPLFVRLFVTATSINFLPITLGGTVPEIAVLAVLHFLLLFRIRSARLTAGAQRQADLERFTALRAAAHAGPPPAGS